MGGYHIAIVGATGAAGTELLRVLERRSFPVASLRPIGSARSVGKSVQFCGDPVSVEKLEAKSFEKIDIAFFSAGGEVSRNFVPIACQADAIAIDKSSAFRMDPHVPLVIPEINADDVKHHRGIIANPNCTATVMLIALYPLHKIFRVHRVFAATYQAVSGSGTRGVEELTRQIKETSPESQAKVGHPSRLSSSESEANEVGHPSRLPSSESEANEVGHPSRLPSPESEANEVGHPSRLPSPSPESQVDKVGHPSRLSSPESQAGRSRYSGVFPHPIAFNVLPHVDSFLDNGYTKEEIKMQDETRKIMHLPTLRVSATCV